MKIFRPTTTNLLHPVLLRTEWRHGDVHTGATSSAPVRPRVARKHGAVARADPGMWLVPAELREHLLWWGPVDLFPIAWCPLVPRHMRTNDTCRPNNSCYDVISYNYSCAADNAYEWENYFTRIKAIKVNMHVFTFFSLSHTHGNSTVHRWNLLSANVRLYCYEHHFLWELWRHLRMSCGRTCLSWRRVRHGRGMC